MSAENPMAELLKTMKYIINTFPQNDYERPLTCFLGLMAFEGTGIFFSSIIPENSHQPIIKELLLKIDVDGLNDRSIVFILIASIIYGYRDIFNQSVPSGFRDLFVARTLYKFERKGWNYNG
jgi:hypothetical protein